MIDYVPDFIDTACKTRNTVYRIKCGKCLFRYIGQSGNELHIRVNNHRADVKKGLDECTEIQHFLIHPFADASIDIVDVVDDTEQRKIREDECIIKENTLFPYGLNDIWCGTNFKTSSYKVCVYRIFPKPLYIGLKNRGKKGTISDNDRFVDIKKFLAELEEAYIISNTPVKIVKTAIFSLKKSILKVICGKMTKVVFKNLHFKALLFDMVKFRLDIDIITPINDTVQSDNYCVMHYDGSFIGLDLKKLLYSQDNISLFPKTLKYPTATYKLDRALGSMIYNYRQFTQEVSLEQIEKLPCPCNLPEYVGYKDTFHGHVCTGNLDVVKDIELRSILGRGSKFRFFKPVAKRKYINILEMDINRFIIKTSYKHGIPITAFFLWKKAVFTQITRCINAGTCKRLEFNFKQIKSQIEKLQNIFIITPVDKATNNFAFICKKFYAQVIAKELSSNGTYERYDYNCNALIKKQIIANAGYEIKVDKSFHNIPFFFCTPKFHKNPVKFRFITSSVSTVNKPLCICINNFLDRLKANIITVSNNATYKWNWIVEKNQDILNTINNINNSVSSDSELSLVTYDFTTLYTKISLTLLEEVLFKLIEEFWNETFYNYKYVRYSLERIKSILSYGLNNNYIKVGGHIYKQIIGIPMGANYSGNLANLFLLFYEKKFMDANPNKDKYRYTFRYIDDLIAINNRLVHTEIDNIYPDCMVVEGTSMEPFTSAHYLDLNIEVVNDKFRVELYDKRRDFNFTILGFPHFLSNVPMAQTKNTFCGQIIRYHRICGNNNSNFVYNLKLLIKKFKNNSFPGILLQSWLCYCYKKYPFLYKVGVE